LSDEFLYLSEKQAYMKREAIVIGSGIGGLAVSVRLAVAGYQVRVFEKEAGPGGKLSSFTLGNYRYDLGPSLFTMPQFVDELFLLAGKNPEHYFRYQKWPLACRYFWDDGTLINSWSDAGALAREVQEVLGADPQRIRDFLKHAQKLYRLNAPVFLEKSLHKPFQIGWMNILKALVYMPRMDIFKSMNRANQQRLRHPQLVQMFNRMATYNGSNPYQAPGILNIIPALEHGYGVFFPEGGMYNITKALHRLAVELGVGFSFNEEVKSIQHKQGRVEGVETSKGSYKASLVVSNMDVVLSYSHLLKGVSPPSRILKQERSSSAMVFYWGVKKVFPQFDLHNILFSNQYQLEFEHIFKHKSL